MLFTLVYSGFEPKIACEEFDSFGIRLHKIRRQIQKSRYSIHDLSRLRSEKQGDIARLNMPFELGIDYGCRVFGNKKVKNKKCLILEEKKYRYLRAISDLGGVDIKAHKSKKKELAYQVRAWLITFRKNVESGSVICDSYNYFTDHFDRITKGRGWRKRDYDLMAPPEYINYINVI